MEILVIVAVIIIAAAFGKAFLRPKNLIDDAMKMKARLEEAAYEDCNYCGAKRPRGPGDCPSCGAAA